MDAEKQAGLTSPGSLTGTPLYMSPESIEAPASVDARSDIYAVGAVGYFLLTGEPVFAATNLVELCQQHVNETPIRPSKRLGKTVSIELENAILSSLEKSPAKRPQTARDLAHLLEQHCNPGAWTNATAETWWGYHERGEDPSIVSRPSNNTEYSVVDETPIENQPSQAKVAEPQIENQSSQPNIEETFFENQPDQTDIDETQVENQPDPSDK
jgi:serine/threonine protein kinase